MPVIMPQPPQLPRLAPEIKPRLEQAIVDEDAATIKDLLTTPNSTPHDRAALVKLLIEFPASFATTTQSQHATPVDSVSSKYREFIFTNILKLLVVPIAASLDESDPFLDLSSSHLRTAIGDTEKPALPSVSPEPTSSYADEYMPSSRPMLDLLLKPQTLKAFIGDCDAVSSLHPWCRRWVRHLLVPILKKSTENHQIWSELFFKKNEAVFNSITGPNYDYHWRNDLPSIPATPWKLLATLLQNYANFLPKWVFETLREYVKCKLLPCAPLQAINRVIWGDPYNRVKEYTPCEKHWLGIWYTGYGLEGIIPSAVELLERDGDWWDAGIETVEEEEERRGNDEDEKRITIRDVEDLLVEDIVRVLFTRVTVTDRNYFGVSGTIREFFDDIMRRLTGPCWRLTIQSKGVYSENGKNVAGKMRVLRRIVDLVDEIRKDRVASRLRDYDGDGNYMYHSEEEEEEEKDNRNKKMDKYYEMPTGDVDLEWLPDVFAYKVMMLEVPRRCGEESREPGAAGRMINTEERIFARQICDLIQELAVPAEGTDNPPYHFRWETLKDAIKHGVTVHYSQKILIAVELVALWGWRHGARGAEGLALVEGEKIGNGGENMKVEGKEEEPENLEGYDLVLGGSWAPSKPGEEGSGARRKRRGLPGLLEEHLIQELVCDCLLTVDVTTKLPLDEDKNLTRRVLRMLFGWKEGPVELFRERTKRTLEGLLDMTDVRNLGDIKDWL